MKVRMRQDKGRKWRKGREDGRGQVEEKREREERGGDDEGEVQVELVG